MSRDKRVSTYTQSTRPIIFEINKDGLLVLANSRDEFKNYLELNSCISKNNLGATLTINCKSPEVFKTITQVLKNVGYDVPDSHPKDPLFINMIFPLIKFDFSNNSSFFEVVSTSLTLFFQQLCINWKLGCADFFKMKYFLFQEFKKEFQEHREIYPTKIDNFQKALQEFSKVFSLPSLQELWKNRKDFKLDGKSDYFYLGSNKVFKLALQDDGRLKQVSEDISQNENYFCFTHYTCFREGPNNQILEMNALLKLKCRTSEVYHAFINDLEKYGISLSKSNENIKIENIDDQKFTLRVKFPLIKFNCSGQAGSSFQIVDSSIKKYFSIKYSLSSFDKGLFEKFKEYLINGFEFIAKNGSYSNTKDAIKALIEFKTSFVLPATVDLVIKHRYAKEQKPTETAKVLVTPFGFQPAEKSEKTEESRARNVSFDFG